MQSMGDRERAIHAQEVMRRLDELPEDLWRDDGAAIRERIQQDYAERQVYVAYLTQLKQRLLATRATLRRQLERAQHIQRACEGYVVIAKVHRFLKAHADDIQQFVSTFEACEQLDEKSVFTARFMTQARCGSGPGRLRHRRPSITAHPTDHHCDACGSSMGRRATRGHRSGRAAAGEATDGAHL